MIFGIGTDIVRVARMARSLERYRARFAARILAASELADFDASVRKAHFLAKRFAAKEAAAKAMGTGFQNGLQLRQITVRNDPLGKPMLDFGGRAADFARRHGIVRAHLSISDEDEFAVAFVVLETA